MTDENRTHGHTVCPLHDTNEREHRVYERIHAKHSRDIADSSASLGSCDTAIANLREYIDGVNSKTKVTDARVWNILIGVALTLLSSGATLLIVLVKSNMIGSTP